MFEIYMMVPEIHGIHISDKTWQAHHTELQAYTEHLNNARGVSTWTDQRIVKEIGRIYLHRPYPWKWFTLTNGTQ